MTIESEQKDELGRLVKGLYRAIVGREADPGGLKAYVDHLVAGAPLADVVNSMVSSDEYKQRNPDSLLRASPPQRTEVRLLQPSGAFPEGYCPPGEAGRSYLERLRSGFFHKYCSGPLVLDVGYSGYDNPEKKAAFPHAIGIDLDYPGYDGIRLPFEDGTVDTIFSSHCLEHILFDHAAIRDWYRVLKTGGFMVCMVPSQALYEKKRFLPSKWNTDHKRMYTPSSLAAAFETALAPNSYRVRHLAENDLNFNYSLGPDVHSDGAYEIEIVIEKIEPPEWGLL